MVVTFDVSGRRSAAPRIVVVHDDDEEEEEESSDLLKVAQDRAMEERPYGGGRSVVGPDAALCNANYVMQGRKGQNQSFVEDFFELQTL
jgi:hypothetical protein